MIKKEAPVEVVVIMDRSGSMASLQAETVGGVNEFLKEQQAQEGEANLTLVLFDNKYEMKEESTPIQDVKPWTKEDFTPRGSTALYDAVGRTMHYLFAKNPKHAIISIITDGQENASQEFKFKDIKPLMEKARAKGWEVVFMASNMDAEVVGTGYGIMNNATFAATSAGENAKYKNLTGSTIEYRSTVRKDAKI